MWVQALVKEVWACHSAKRFLTSRDSTVEEERR